MRNPEFYHFIWGHLQARRHAPLALFSHFSREKKIQPLRFFHKKAYLINDPDLIQTTLTQGSTKFVRGFGYKQMIPFMGNGLITSDGEFWIQQRRLMHSAFTSKHYQDWFQIANEQADLLIEKWLGGEPNKEIDLSHDITRMTIQVICRAMFGFKSASIEDSTVEALDIIMEEVFHRVLRVRPWGSREQERRFAKAVESIRKIAAKILDDGDETQGPLLKILKEKMPRNQALNEVVTIFLAGFESSSATLAWTLYLLSRNPQISQDLKNIVSEKPAPSLVSAAELNEVPLIKACIQETMRLYPAIWILARENSKTETLGDTTIPAGSIIQICPYSLHRDEKLWPQANEFRPARFIELPAEKRHKGSYIPFGLGPHICIGAQLAMIELQVSLYKILTKLEIQIGPQEISPEPLITLRPGTPVRGFVRKANS